MADNNVLEQDGRSKVHYWVPVVWADVETSTGIIVERRKQFRAAITENLGTQGDTLGGAHIVGLRWLDDVKHYNLRWKTARMTDKVGDFKFYEKTLWYYTLKPTVLYMRVEGAETSPRPVAATETEQKKGKESEAAERIPIDMEIIYTAQITNFVQLAYKAPDYYVEKGEELLKAVVRDWVGTKTLDEIYEAKNKGHLWDGVDGKGGIKDDPQFQTLKDDWGWPILDMRIKSVTPPEDIQRAGMLQRQRELEAEAGLQSTAVKWRKMVAYRTGLTAEDIEAKMKGDFSKFREDYGPVADECWKQIVLETELNAKARFHLENEGGIGPEGWIALAKLLGGFVGGSSSGKAEPGDKKGKEEVEGKKTGKKGKGKKMMGSSGIEYEASEDEQDEEEQE